MARNHVYISMRAGHVRKYLEAMRDGLDVAIRGMEKVRETCCEVCGAELVVEEVLENAVDKMCPDCGERYCFRTAGGDQ